MVGASFKGPGMVCNPREKCTKTNFYQGNGISKIVAQLKFILHIYKNRNSQDRQVKMTQYIKYVLIVLITDYFSLHFFSTFSDCKCFALIAMDNPQNQLQEVDLEIQLGDKSQDICILRLISSISRFNLELCLCLTQICKIILY